MTEEMRFYDRNNELTDRKHVPYTPEQSEADVTSYQEAYRNQAATERELHNASELMGVIEAALKDDLAERGVRVEPGQDLTTTESPYAAALKAAREKLEEKRHLARSATNATKANILDAKERYNEDRDAFQEDAWTETFYDKSVDVDWGHTPNEMEAARHARDNRPVFR